MLPSKPSELITLALEDLKKTEAMPDVYEAHMGNWHEQEVNGKCSVCLAGSVMAQTMGADPLDYLVPADFDEQDKLVALDDFRVGHVRSGVTRMGFNLDVEDLNFEPMGYHQNRDSWFRQMEQLAAKLKERGL